jgi:class 3 adenylate cyclase
MFRRRSLILVLVIGVLAIYSVINYYSQKRILRDDFDRVVLTRENQLKAYLLLGFHMGKAGLWDELHDQLDDAVKAEQIDFYILQYKDMPAWYGSYQNSFDGSKFSAQVLDQTVATPSTTLHTLTVGPDYKLTLGIAKNLDLYVERNMKAFTGLLWEEMIYYTLVVALVALWVFRDLIVMLARMRKGKLSALPKAHTYEAELLKRGIEGFAATNAALTQQTQTYANQLLPSLKKELLSGRKQPYDFHCTLVRTDINNFSDIFNNHDATEFLAEINAFFSEVSHVVSRYRGLVHEFVGDEVLYYFKDEEHPNSFAMALSAIRDINAVASQFNERCLKEKGYPFTVKSSLAHGKLRFGPLVNGFSFAGSILIETVRILSQVNERDGNVVYFDSRHLPMIDGYCRSAEAVTTTLKGFSTPSTLYKYVEHAPLWSALESLRYDQLICYRGDRDLCQIIGYLSEHHAQLNKEKIVDACSALRAAQMTKPKSEVAIALRDWLVKIEELSSVSKAFEDFKVLSTIIGLISYLVSQSEFQDLFAEKLPAFLKHSDPRLVANTLDVLSRFGHNENKAVTDLRNHENNRVAANAILYFGRQELSRDVISRLKKMILSQKSDWVVSGLRVVSELTEYHMKRDPAAFRMQIEFLDLFDHIRPLVASEDPKIQKNAARAASLLENTSVELKKAI